MQPPEGKSPVSAPGLQDKRVATHNNSITLWSKATAELVHLPSAPAVQQTDMSSSVLAKASGNRSITATSSLCTHYSCVSQQLVYHYSCVSLQLCITAACAPVDS
jgi:hypothetical protein